jgi:signal transduction histidine kinase
MLDHCFTNILGNAVKYSPENSTVKILGALVENKILVKIIDNGIGIPKDDLKNIGEKFYRAKNTLKISGTGIGLYLTKYFIKLHNGQVLIQSVEGQGSEVTIVLPIKNEK